MSAPLLPPSLAHPLGTDPLGNDALLELLEGIPTSVEVLVLASASSLAFLLLVSFLAIINKKVAEWISSTLVGVPRLPLLVFLALTLKLEPWSIALLVGTLAASLGAGHVASRAEEVAGKPFYLASLAAGSTKAMSWFKHVLPNSLFTILSYVSLASSVAVYAEAGAAMLGLEDPSTPSLGKLAYLVLNTPGAVLTEAGLVQVVASSISVVLLAYVGSTTWKRLAEKLSG